MKIKHLEIIPYGLVMSIEMKFLPITGSKEILKSVKPWPL